MTPKEALDKVRKKFPFEGYMQITDDPYLDIARTVLRELKPGARILDFGAGPCDKTAVLSCLGFQCVAYDDLQDYWHKIDCNRDKIMTFAKDFGIQYKLADRNKKFGTTFAVNLKFDMILMCDVLEHLHNSPRQLLNDLLELVRNEGYFLATVPNLVNLRKRIAVLLGKTNLPRFEDYYWYPNAVWRGHIREYTKDDLIKLAEYLNLDIVELRSCHHMLHVLPAWARPLFVGLTFIFPGWRDTWLLVAKKKYGWKPKRSLEPHELKKVLGKSTSYQY